MAVKTKDLRGMRDEQLGLTLKDTEKHLFQLRFQSATDRLETPSEIAKARRDIARIKTIQRHRELPKEPKEAKCANNGCPTSPPGRRRAERPPDPRGRRHPRQDEQDPPGGRGAPGQAPTVR